MVKDTDEQLDEEIQRARSGRLPSAGAFAAVELAVPRPPGTWMLANLETLQTSFYGDFSGGLLREA